VRAALEASAFQTVEVAQAMQKDSGHIMPLVRAVTAAWLGGWALYEV
jgi:glycerol kinase